MCCGSTNVMACLPITRRQILDSSKLKGFADDNFKFEVKLQKVIQTGRKHCGKRRNCLLQAIYPFPTLFSKGLFPRDIKRCRCVGMGYGTMDQRVVLSALLPRQCSFIKCMIKPTNHLVAQACFTASQM